MAGGKRKGAGRKKGSVTSKNKWKKICTKLSPESIKKLDGIVKKTNKMKCDVIDDAVKEYSSCYMGQSKNAKL